MFRACAIYNGFTEINPRPTLVAMAIKIVNFNTKLAKILHRDVNVAPNKGF